MLPKRAGNFIVVRTGNIQGEFFIKPGPFFHNLGKQLAIAHNLIAGFPRQQFLFNKSKFPALHILKRQVMSPGKRFSDNLTRLVLLHGEIVELKSKNNERPTFNIERSMFAFQNREP